MDSTQKSPTLENSMDSTEKSPFEEPINSTIDEMPPLQRFNFIVSKQVAYLRRVYRVFDLSAFDYIASYILIFLLLTIFKIPFNPKYYTAMIPIAVIAHLLAGQQTTFTRKLMNDELNFPKIWLPFVTFMTIYNHLYYIPKV